MSKKTPRTRIVGGFVDWLQDQLIAAAFGQLSALEDRVTELETRMATTAEKLTQIDEATTRQAEGLQKVADLVTSIKGQVANLDSNLADKLTPVVEALNGHADKLFELAADPQNPVPNPEPVPDVPPVDVPVS